MKTLRSRWTMRFCRMLRAYPELNLWQDRYGDYWVAAGRWSKRVKFERRWPSARLKNVKL